MAYYELKHQCLYCDAAFIVYSPNISACDINKTHCPQCGARGTCLRHDEIHDGDIDDVVPGESPLSHVAEHVEEQLFENSDLHSYSLKKDIREQIDTDIWTRKIDEKVEKERLSSIVSGTTAS